MTDISPRTLALTVTVYGVASALAVALYGSTFAAWAWPVVVWTWGRS